MAKLRGSYIAAKEATKATIKLASDQIDSLIVERDSLRALNSELLAALEQLMIYAQDTEDLRLDVWKDAKKVIRKAKAQ